MADSPVADYQVQRSNGQFKVVGKPYGTAPYGIAIPKGNGMAKPVLAGLEALMADGRYQAILKKWGVQQGAISSPEDQRGDQLAASRGVLGPDRGAAGATRRRGAIKAVPVRHTGRWVAAAIVLVLGGHGRALDRDQSPLRVGARPALLLLGPGPPRVAHHARADRHRDGDRDRARRRARGDAPVAQPAGVRRELVLHLALPRHAGARPAPVLAVHLGALSAHLARDPVRSRARARRREHA